MVPAYCSECDRTFKDRRGLAGHVNARHRERAGTIWDPPRDTRSQKQLLADAAQYGLDVSPYASKDELRLAIVQVEREIDRIDAEIEEMIECTAASI